MGISLEIVLNVFKPYNIACSTKILTQATAPVYFISGGILREFAMLADVYILLFPQEQEVHCSS